MELFSRIRPTAFFVVLLIAVLVLTLSPLWGQQATGNVTGVVADKSGALIPKATVVLTDQETGTTRKTGQQQLWSFRLRLRPTRHKLQV